MGLTLNNARFMRTLDAMRQVPGKHGPDVVNKGVEKIVIGSKGSKGLVHLTKRTSRDRIKDDLLRPVTSVSSRGGSHTVPLVILLAAKNLAKSGAGPTKTGTGKKFGKNHGDKLWRAMVKARAKRIFAYRQRSVAATVAGWLIAYEKLKMAAHLGGAATMQGVRKGEEGSASKSYARIASTRRLLAGLYNMTDDSGIVCSPIVIQTAINAATADNLVYLERKLGAGIRDAVNGTSTAHSVS